MKYPSLISGGLALRTGLATVLLSCASFAWSQAARPAPAANPAAELAALAEKARAEGGFTLYTSTPQRVISKVVDDFKKSYPGINVTLLQSSANGITETFLADFSRKAVKASVVQMASNQQVDDVAATGALEPYVPIGANRLRPDTRTAEPMATNIYLNAVTWAWRSNLPPALKQRLSQGDWAVFDDPEVVKVLRGRVGAADPALVGSAFSALQGLKLANEARYPKILASFGALKPVFYESNVPAINALRSGELLAIYAHHGLIVDAIGAGAPIETAFFNPTPAGSSFLSLPKNAPHPSAGRLFIAWVISNAGQESFAQHYSVESAVVGTNDTRAQTTKPWYTKASHDATRIVVISPKAIKAYPRAATLSEFNSIVRP